MASVQLAVGNKACSSTSSIFMQVLQVTALCNMLLGSKVYLWPQRVHIILDKASPYLQTKHGHDHSRNGTQAS